MKRRTLLKLVGIGAVAEGLAIACGGATTAPSPAPATGAATPKLAAATAAPTKAPGTGKLNLLGALVGDINDGFAKAYEAETGVKTAAVRLSAGEGLAKLRADKANPQFSVWLGGAADGFIAAAKEGLLEPYKPAGSEKLAAAYKDAGGTWTGYYLGVLGVALNTKVLKDKNLPEPKSWADLTKPAYKGQISMAHPASSGTAYTMMATILQLFGKDTPEKGFAYLADFHKNVLQYQKSGAAPARQAGQGEVAIGVVFAHDILATIDAGFKDLKIMYPSEGTGWEIGAIGLVKGAPDRVEGERFLDWMMGAKAQSLLLSLKAYQLPLNPEAAVNPATPKLSSVKVIDYDYVWAGDRKKQFVDRFSNEIAPAPK
jgi:iron(III) transport system substrate-binding protein